MFKKLFGHWYLVKITSFPIPVLLGITIYNSITIHSALEAPTNLNQFLDLLILTNPYVIVGAALIIMWHLYIGLLEIFKDYIHDDQVLNLIFFLVGVFVLKAAFDLVIYVLTVTSLINM